MTMQRAQRILRQGTDDRDLVAEAIMAVHDAVRVYCNTCVNPPGETSLHDWLSEGDWSGPPVSAQDLAREWDEVTTNKAGHP